MGLLLLTIFLPVIFSHFFTGLITAYYMPCVKWMATCTPRKCRAPSSVRLLGLRDESVSSAVQLGLGFVVTLVPNVLGVGSRLSFLWGLGRGHGKTPRSLHALQPSCQLAGPPSSFSWWWPPPCTQRRALCLAGGLLHAPAPLLASSVLCCFRLLR